MFCCCRDNQPDMEEVWEYWYRSQDLNANLIEFMSRLDSNNPYVLLPEWHWLYRSGRVPKKFSELHAMAAIWYEMPHNRGKKKKAIEFFKVLHTEGEISERTYLL